ncbi:MAG TPA: hypothetical protein VFU93_10455 [Acidimicrobiales bacterium]|nr:hypothetical protein [Acidimicrobiales bacterium]
MRPDDHDDSNRIISLPQLEARWTSDEATTVVRLAGHLDATAEDEVCRITTVADAAPGIYIDLTDVQYVDDVGLDLVQELERHPAIVIQGTSPAIERARA